MATKHLLLAAVVACAGACDQSAKATSPGGVENAQGSGEYETCASSMHCKGDLRCVDGSCRSSETSVVGDYFAAAGRRHLKNDDVAEAIAAYTRAVNQYKVEEIPVPTSHYCDQGHALTHDRGDSENAELAARVLHRCVRDLPPHSSLRRRALADLAALREVGLDPMLLGSKEDADRYLTKAPKAPPVDEVRVQTESTIGSSKSSFTNWLAKIESDQVRDQLLACWKAYHEATDEEALEVTLPFNYHFYQGYYPDQDRHKLDIEQESPSPTSPQKTAEACVQGVLAPIADTYSKEEGGSGRWKGPITITLAVPE